MKKEDLILDSWQQNAQNWIDTIKHQEILSRQLATNRAILEAVLATCPLRTLDVGCGEGWLTRALSAQKIQAVGVDGVIELIEYARRESDDPFFLLSYKELVRGQNRTLGVFDTIVFNFSLFGKEMTFALLKKLYENLELHGKMVIQTLHPEHELANSKNSEGWVRESWSAMKRKYRQPYHWYFRDRQEWAALFEKAGYLLLEEKTIPNPEDGAVLSIILTVERGLK